MSPAPPVGDLRQRSKRKAIALATIVVLVLLTVVALALAWQRWREGKGSAEQRERLQAAVERGRGLSAELASIKPANAPECPPGQSLKTFAPGSLLPAPGASSAPALTAPAGGGTKVGAAVVLSDYALAQRLEKITAMVLVDDGGKLSGGTGFFITPNLLVTNRHVVGGPNAQLLLVSKSLGSVRRATLLKVTQSHEIGSPDFALVRLDDGTAPSVVDVAADVGKLAPVVAAGYPAVVIKDDPNFRRLLQGDPSAAPDLNLTQGAVQSLQHGASGTPLLVHTASIAKGNSGGPLIDACGRVVGVNTYISVDQAQSAKINYAIRSESMFAFLATAGATARTDPRTCGARE